MRRLEYPPRYFVVHHSASPREATTAERIRRWHLARGWSDIGYHWVIEADGEIVSGRPAQYMGAHVRGANDESLGVCLVGDNRERGDDAWSRSQVESLRELERAVRLLFPAIETVRHCDLAGTECPIVELPPGVGGATGGLT